MVTSLKEIANLPDMSSRRGIYIQSAPSTADYKKKCQLDKSMALHNLEQVNNRRSDMK